MLVKLIRCGLLRQAAIGNKGALSYSTKTTTTKEASNPVNKASNLYASVCIERLPIITCDMNDLEQRYSNLINSINIRKSLLSDHEIRNLKDLERMAKNKIKKEKGEEEEVILETAADYHEKNLKKLKEFKFVERKLSANQPEFDPNSNTNKTNFQNIDHILDKKLILLVNDTNTPNSNWELPKIEWTEEDVSLRSTAERSVHNLNGELVVDFLGNAPVGFYKNKNQKVYFFKAQYKSGAEFLAKSKMDYIWIRKDELKNFIKDKNYLACLNDFILDF